MGQGNGMEARKAKGIEGKGRGESGVRERGESDPGCERQETWGKHDGRMGLGLLGMQRGARLWLTSCARLARMTLMEWRTSAEAVGTRGNE